MQAAAFRSTQIIITSPDPSWIIWIAPQGLRQQRIYLADADSHSKGSSVTEKTLTFEDSSPKKHYLILSEKEKGVTPMKQKPSISLSRGGR